LDVFDFDFDFDFLNPKIEVFFFFVLGKFSIIESWWINNWRAINWV